MPKYRIKSREEHIQVYEVEAKDKEEAVDKYLGGEVEEKELKFSHTIADSVGEDDFEEVT